MHVLEKMDFKGQLTVYSDRESPGDQYVKHPKGKSCCILSLLVFCGFRGFCWTKRWTNHSKTLTEPVLSYYHQENNVISIQFSSLVRDITYEDDVSKHYQS